MAKAKNRYAKKAKKKHFLSGMNNPLPTKGNLKNTALETGKDLLVGVIGGGLIGAAIGKPSLFIGIAVTGLGHYSDNKLATIFGVGMMASNGFQGSKATNGLSGLEGVKERLQSYKESFSEKLFIDKLMKAKTKTAKPVGELQYFTHPGSDWQSSLAALDSIEDQVEESGMQFQQLNDAGSDIIMMDVEERMF
jgi:hypothetical protein